MSEDQNFRFINNLPQKPNSEELTAKRKGLRKMKLPVFTSSEYGSCPQLGRYKVIFDKQPYFEWHFLGKETKNYSFIDFCTSSDLELDCLDLGWLIVDLYNLEKTITIQQVAGPNETMSILSWYAKREDPWRRWALVPAGHMLSK